MSNLGDDQPLFDLAATVVDVSKVDWRAVEEDVDSDELRSLMPAFKLLAAVGNVGRLDEPLPDEAPGVLALKAGDEWGRFRLEEVIGHGSYGTVYRARDPLLETDVALKLFHRRSENSEIEAERALDEARRLSRIRHENVVRVLGAEIHRGRVGLWMELITGHSLSDVLKSQGPCSADEARTIGAALCRAVAAVHAAGFIHQDIKAANVVRAEGGRIVLMDLGAGIRVAGGSAPARQVIGGTPLYIAPEIFDGHPPSQCSDVYSLGVLLFHLVTNRYPVEGADRFEVERAHRLGRRLRLRDARPDLADEFVRAIEQAVAPDPRERYATAGELDAALASSAGRRRRVLPWAAAGVVALMALAALALRGSIEYPAGWRANGTVAAVVTAAGAPATLVTQSGPYRIRASFYRRRGTRDELLRPGQRLGLNDTVALKVSASAPVYVYVVNQDEQGVGYLLYPLAKNFADVPQLPAGEMQLPPPNESDGWVLNSRGGREHFLVAVSRSRLNEFELQVQGLPRPQFNAPTAPLRLSDAAVRALRGAGGLAPPKVSNPVFAFADATPLDSREESASGPWIRLITFDNP